MTACGRAKRSCATCAMRRETARHVSTKLARHFIADDPPKAVVDRMTHAWLDSKAHLPTVYKALVESPEAWEQPLAKFKTPADYIYSSYRALGIPLREKRRALQPFEALGQRNLMPGFARRLAGRERGLGWFVGAAQAHCLGRRRSRSAWAMRATHATWRRSC